MDFDVNEYNIRREAADSFNERAKEFFESIFVGGSVGRGYGVTAQSNLNITAIGDLRNLEYKAFCKTIHQPYDAIIEKCLKEGKANVVVIRWKKDFEIGLNLWDKQALELIVSLSHKPLRVLGRADFNGISLSEKLFGLKGEELIPSPNHREEYGGGVIQKLHPFYEDKDDIYIGVFPNTLLMKPRILSDNKNYLSHKIKELGLNLSEHIERIHDKKRRNLSFMNALPDKIKDKVPRELRQELDRLVRGQ
ncbi:MAG: hypothetical protein AABW88_01375 [Nanoarchaeota archaeon]